MGKREVTRVFGGTATRDGAGVTLERVFGWGKEKLFDPFLLLDSFGSKDPRDYLPGFPFHPHRGIETVTYMLEGKVKHRDSLGNQGTIGPGDIQWMTAGGGIIHEEMPQRSPEGVRGLQLWVNLPQKHKMTSPKYRDLIASEIPSVKLDTAEVKIIAGSYRDVPGALRDIIINPTYLDINLYPQQTLDLEASLGETVFAFLYEGNLGVKNATEPEKLFQAGSCILFGDGEGVEVFSGSNGARFIFLRGKPLKEPIAWGGPIVMNTQKELDQAFREYAGGTFLKGDKNS